jgi:hypothetical protein
MDAIAQSIGPDDAQNGALKNAGRVAHEVADKLAQTCPMDVPREPSTRLDAMERGIDAVDAALSGLQPPLQVFYDTLKDDQKARLVARYLVSSPSVAPETTGSGGRAFETSRAFETGMRRRSRASANQVPATVPVAQMWSCEQWQAELRAWPVARIEQVIAVGPRQRAAFYLFAAAMQRAADMVADSCPQESALTPIGRVEELKKKLEAIRRSVAEIRPSLGQFYDVLDTAQKNRLSDAI